MADIEFPPSSLSRVYIIVGKRASNEMYWMLQTFFYFLSTLQATSTSDTSETTPYYSNGPPVLGALSFFPTVPIQKTASFSTIVAKILVG